MTAYTVTRFFSNCSDKTRKLLNKAFKDGDQLAAAAIPKDALPAILILAAYALRIDIELVDDYAELLERTREALKIGGVHHPDLFLASSICILAERGDVPTIGAFTQVGVDGILTDLLELE